MTRGPVELISQQRLGLAMTSTELTTQQRLGLAMTGAYGGDLVTSSVPKDDPTTTAANPSHYQGFSRNSQPADICEHLSWNAGEVIRRLSRGSNKAELGLTPEQTYMQNLKKSLWHIKREIMLHGGNPDDVLVPNPHTNAAAPRHYYGGGCHPETGDPYWCEGCSVIFRTHEDLERHLNANQ